ncbi:protein of unknown function [Candidatus Nitrospira inopinata]|uniref:Uncharacterized protein n=1 Tax=Candidatus Nitrospira inopinata TaxID=1715989 RepID=A0A0S4KS64_9BACT|nr:protein of unknown function [Candidatus Nitrospira inopinata]
MREHLSTAVKNPSRRTIHQGVIHGQDHHLSQTDLQHLPGSDRASQRQRRILYGDQLLRTAV